MKKYLLLAAIAVMFTSTPSYALNPGNENAETVFNTIKECYCKEVLIISGGVEKAYSRDWLQGMKQENSYIVFAKGDVKHYWNVESVVFIDWSGDVLRVYLEAKAR
ncbi:MAG: hypothetical protein AB7G44_08040 [Bacteroidia bacterium]